MNIKEIQNIINFIKKTEKHKEIRAADISRAQENIPTSTIQKVTVPQS